MLNRRIIIRFFLAAVIFVGLGIPINKFLILPNSADPKIVRGQSKPPIQVLPRLVNPKNNLVVQDPKRYGVTVQQGDYSAWNERQWDSSTQKMFSQSEALDHMEQNNAFESMKKTPDAFQKRWDEINQRIKFYEVIKQRSPSNTEARKKLESLYRMRSTLSILKDKIVTPPGETSSDKK